MFSHLLKTGVNTVIKLNSYYNKLTDTLENNFYTEPPPISRGVIME